MKFFAALLVALGGIASSATAQIPVAPRGCWELRTTPLGDADETPSVFRLDSVLGVEVGDCGRPLVRTVTGPPRKVWIFAYWRRLSTDSIAVVWSDGVSGLMLRLAVSGDTLTGFASTFSDAPGDRPKRADAIATRVICPPPDSSAFVRSVEATSAGLREVRLEMPSFSMEVGDSIFARGEGISGDGQAMRPLVVWTSSDSSVITVDSTGLVRGRASGSATLTVITRDASATRRIIVSPRTFRAMTVSAYRACGLSIPGTLYCWGAESAEHPATRVPRPMRTPRNLVSLTAGFSHFCALDDLGRAFCWGDNDYGELGTGTFAMSTTPVQVAGGITFAEVSAGSHFTCGATRGGIAYCWGLNDGGELGAGGAPAGSCGQAGSACGNLPVKVASPVPLHSLSASDANACAIGGGGDIYCWGLAQSAREPKRITADVRFATVSSGGDNGCAVAGDGRAFCWGNNQYGQLGNGTRRASARPASVAGAMRFESIIAYENTTCALTTTGKAYCWGLDSHGSLGLLGAAPDQCVVPEQGTVSCATRPVAVDGGQLFVKLVRSTGSGTCGLTLSGVAYCWGTSTPVSANLHACVSTSGPLPVTGAPIDPRRP